MPPRPKKRTAENKSNVFLDALKFLSLVTKDVGPPCETHVYLSNNWACASNGVIAAGHKISEDIFACPNNKLMIEALSKCNENFSITQLDNNRLSIKSDKFKAVIPCIEPILLAVVGPDAPIADINDKFKEAAEAVNVLTGDNGQDILNRSLLMRGKSIVGTNGKIIFEYWHGIDLPPDLVIPKDIVNPLVKNSKKLMKFGFSPASITFWFEDDSWIKTQLYAEHWPKLDTVLDQKCNPWPVPADFFTGLAAVAPFSTDGLVYFDHGTLRSHRQEGTGASFTVAGLPRGPIFSARQLALLKPHASQIDFLAPGPHPGTTCLYFYGTSMRGVVAGRIGD
jgi:hypothetical protein